jgi:hypothetical protein
MFLPEIRKFPEDLLWAVFRRKIPKDKADRNPGAFDPRFASKDIRGTLYVILPCDSHAHLHFQRGSG